MPSGPSANVSPSARAGGAERTPAAMSAAVPATTPRRVAGGFVATGGAFILGTTGAGAGLRARAEAEEAKTRGGATDARARE